MAHFAKLGACNYVLNIHSVHINVLLVDGVENEQKGVDFLNNLFKTKDIWKQTSYNTRRGVHKLGGTPFRKNYAGKGYWYDRKRDAFISPKPHPSWVLDEETCDWESPIGPRPLDGRDYEWDEETKSWKGRH